MSTFALLRSLSPTPKTAEVRARKSFPISKEFFRAFIPKIPDTNGVNNTTGVGLVEVYELD